MTSDAGPPGVPGAGPASPRLTGVAGRPALLALGLVGAMLLRTGLAGGRGAASVPAGAAFGLCLVATAGLAGCRPSVPRLRPALIGTAGGLVLILLPLTGAGIVHVGPAAPAGALAVWAPLVAFIAVAEEVVIRGALFAGIETRAGAPVAVVLTSAGFALLHLPLYGAGALPLDVAAGVWLGGLRLLGGGVTAPALAHALADLSTGWLG